MKVTKLLAAAFFFGFLSSRPLAVLSQECVRPAVQALVVVLHVKPEITGGLKDLRADY
ncbi:hypothetical protein [Streptomyces sp. NPDC020965]|uniref:hypothetical protein n=1 Tax=Streptomyces sp. NPDC020965 TaxID=3365105 RepID=UPI00378C0B19